MGHTHTEDRTTYYLEQICTIAVSAVFGVVCVLLWLNTYVWPPPPQQKSMLQLMLVKSFHLPVLLGGIALLILAFARVLAVWSSSRRAGHVHAHDHDHECDHDHDHGHCHHDHGHDMDAVGADQDHDHEHDHAHEHEHDGLEPHSHGPGCAHGHDHGWNPWRYAVLLIPAVFFFLTLPNRDPQVEGKDYVFDGGESAAERTDPTIYLAFSELKDAANTKEQRDFFAGRKARLKGQYAPNPSNSHTFSLVRLKMVCCAADTTASDVLIKTQQPVSGFNPMDWMEVEGVIQFGRQANGGGYVPILVVTRPGEIQKTDRDPNL